MEPRKLQLEILSAQNLKNVNTFGKMTLYAVAWVSPNIKVSTTIDPTGSVKTTSHPLCILTVQKWILQQPNANLQIDISSPGIFSNNHVGSCSVPLSHFQEMDSEGADTVKVISFPACGPSGQTEWMLNLSLKLGDVYQPSAMPGPSSAVAHTVEPNNNNPIMAYSAGYPPQHPSQYPQSYPPVMGPQAPYYPPAGPYAIPPPPQRTGLFGGGFGTGLLGGALGGLGSMEGLLSGARDALLIGQTLLGGSGGGGKTRLGGSGGGGQALLGGSGGGGFGGGLGDGGFGGGPCGGHGYGGGLGDGGFGGGPCGGHGYGDIPCGGSGYGGTPYESSPCGHGGLVTNN